MVTEAFDHLATNATRVHSPVALNKTWSPLLRLFCVASFCTMGTFNNTLFVASIMIEQKLKKLGNVFLACAGIADIFVTALVMPISGVVLLSGQWDNTTVCRIMQFFTETSTYSYSMFYCLVSMETYFRFCRSSREHKTLVKIRVALICTVVFLLAFNFAGYGVYLKLDNDYCERKHHGNFIFRCTTTVIFHVITSLVTLIGLVSSSFHIRRKATKQLQYCRSKQFHNECSLTAINTVAYLVYMTGWMPYLLNVFFFPDSADSSYYNCVWIGVSRAVFSNMLYTIFNSSWRRAYKYLFFYVCCKSTSGGFNRHRRRYKPGMCDIRVHILHQAMRTKRRADSNDTQQL